MTENTNQVQAKRKLARGNSKLLFTIISILLGFLVGAIVLLISGYDPIEGYQALFQGVFKTPRNIGWLSLIHI